MTIEMLILCLAALAGPAAVLSRGPGPEGPYLVVMAPWSSATPVLAQADAWEIGTDSAWIGTVVTGDGGDLAQRLTAAGALLVLDGVPENWICGGQT